MKCRFDAVLFDLDGTLLDTLEDLGAAVNEALRKRGLPLHSVAEYRLMVGHGVRNLVQNALPEGCRCDFAFVDECLADFKDYYSTHIDCHTQPFAGIPELLAELQDAGVKISIASNKFQEGTRMLVKEFFPSISFAAVLGNKEGLPLKPDPGIVRIALEASGIRPAEAGVLIDTGLVRGVDGAGMSGDAEGTVSLSVSASGNLHPMRAAMVGDSPTDVRTALNGGIEPIAVAWGYRSPEELRSAIPDLTLAGTVSELSDLLFI